MSSGLPSTFMPSAKATAVSTIAAITARTSIAAT